MIWNLNIQKDKGKEYCKEGTINYVEYLNGQIWNGKRREYFYDGKLKLKENI